MITAEKDDDIKILLDYTNTHKIPITVRGAGSGKSGGAIPENDGIALSLEAYNNILEVDPDNHCMVVQPGVIVDTIKAAADKHQLFYPPDPSSSDWCTIGGNVAENAGGAAAIGYGVTGDYVLGLEGFFGNGTPFKFGGKCVKDVAGYDMKKLLVGSEGTLAIITQITLKLIPKPDHQTSIWATFNTLEDGAQFIQSLRHNALRITAAEFMEKACINAVENQDNNHIPFNTGNAAVLCRFESPTQAGVDAGLSTLKKQVSQIAGATLYHGDDARYWQVRHAISESLESQYKHKVSEDITVPPGQIIAYLTRVKALKHSDNIQIIAYGHLGDGNIHTNIVNNSLSDAQWQDKQEHWIKTVMSIALELGGTLTGEHGIGLSKKAYMPLSFSEAELSILKQIKAVCDPNHILNPSKLFHK